MQEDLGVAFVAEVPCVIVNVMRGGPSTGLVYSPRLLRTKAGCGSGRSIRSPSFDENCRCGREAILTVLTALLLSRSQIKSVFLHSGQDGVLFDKMITA